MNFLLRSIHVHDLFPNYFVKEENFCECLCSSLDDKAPIVYLLR